MSIELRAPHPGERVVLATTAARHLGVTRQAVDHALRNGRLRGFKNPDDGRLYAELDHIEARLALVEGPGRDRLERLAQEVRSLSDTVHELREQNTLLEQKVRANELRNAQIHLLAEGVIASLETLRGSHGVADL